MQNPFKKIFPGLFDGTKDIYVEDIIPKIINGKVYNEKDFESISTVYTCVRVLSDVISRLPLNVYIESDKGRIADKKDYRYPILHLTPNNYTSSQTFLSTLEYTRNIKGNSFARINRLKNGRIQSLSFLPNNCVVGWNLKNDELYYKVTYDGGDTEEVVPATNILHFKGLSNNGIWGLNPITALRLNLSTTFKGLQTIDTFYENNAVSPKALKSNIPDAAYRAKMKEAKEDFIKEYQGPTNAGKILVLPEYSEVQDLSISLADAEFIATMKYNASQICSLYGVPPAMAGLFEQTKFNNVEQMMLAFKVETVSAILRMYRMEFEMKLLTTEERLSGKSIEFNTGALVETDAATRINNLQKLTQMGVLSPNQVAVIEGYETYDKGDKHYIPSNFTSVEDRLLPVDKDKPA